MMFSACRDIHSTHAYCIYIQTKKETAKVEKREWINNSNNKNKCESRKKQINRAEYFAMKFIFCNAPCMFEYVCGLGCRNASKKGESTAEYRIFAHDYTHVQCKWMLKTKRIVAQMNRKETITSYNGACTRMFDPSFQHRPHTLSVLVSSHESIFHYTESKVFGKSSHIKETDRDPPIRQRTDSQWNYTDVICMYVCIWCLNP